MKKIIWGTIIFGVVLAAAIPFIAEVYVDKKDDREYKKASENLQKFFAQQNKFVSIDYSGESVVYDYVPIPNSPHEEMGDGSPSFMTEKERFEWNERWNGVYRLCKLKPRFERQPGLFGGISDNEWTGWQLCVIEGFSRNGGFNLYLRYPYQVAYKLLDEDWMYSYAPSVQDAIDKSFEFYTHDDEYKKYINNEISVYDVEKAVQSNTDYYKSYYIAFSYDEYARIHGKEYTDSLISSQDWDEISNYGVRYSYIRAPFGKQYSGSMYNSYYSVDIMQHPIRNYLISYNFIHNPKVEDKTNFIIWSEGLLFVLLLITVIVLCRVKSKRRKIANESLKDKLIRLCNPKRFMKPYNEHRLSTANELYDRILKTSESDINALKSIRREIADKLNVNFVDSKKRKELLSKVAPKNFMKPYDAEKVKLANELYTQLRNTNIDIDTLESIEREIAEKLYNK